MAIHGPIELTPRAWTGIFGASSLAMMRRGSARDTASFPPGSQDCQGNPGGGKYDPCLYRRASTACMAPIFGPPVGTPQSAHLRAEALAILETGWRTPYHYDLFAGDVGHTLVLGATGAGKSFSLNFLLVQALQYDPRILILDLGGSYRWLTQFLGGGYMELSPAAADVRVSNYAPSLYRQESGPTNS